MNKRQVAILICTVALVIAAFSLWIPAQNAAPPQGSSQPQRIPAPAPVVYSALFHHILAVKEQAEEVESRGKDASSLRALFRDKASLSDRQADDLDRIAADCVREVAAQDTRAQQIINAFKARFPPGRLPAGVKLPPPPPELKQMQEARDAMILRARDRLRAALGEDGFQRFEGFVTERVASGIEPARLLQRSSARTHTTLPNRSAVAATEGGR